MMADILILFSGGKDSFITACKEATAGNHVHLISFNNGAVNGEENLLHGVKRLQNRYGENHITYVGVYFTGALISQLKQTWLYMTQEDLGRKYPHLINAQLTCLHCQTAMWVAAIAYACAKKIHTIAAGNRKSDPFCTGQKFFIKTFETIAIKRNIIVKLPVWEDDAWVESSGWERDMEMTRFSFEPQVLEPKCVLGQPVNPMNTAQSECMKEYFMVEIAPHIEAQINHLIPIFKAINMSEKSLEAIHYDTPDGSSGLY